MNGPETNGIFAEFYLLKERLSPGQVEEMWKAEDWSANGAPVTVRLYAPQVRLDPHSLEMLQREQEQRSLLQHPHLLVPTSFGVHHGIPFEVAPLQPQQTMAQRLLQQGPIPERDLALLIAHIAGALDYLQRQQPPVAHRQINPDNLLLSENGNYLLAVPALSTQLRTLLHRATGLPLTQGTAYAAPELFGPHPKHTAATDVFALGATLYELGTNEAPWLGGGGLSLNQGADIPVVPAPYSRIFSNLVRACLHPIPDKRPTAKVLAEEAAYYLEHGNWKPYGAFGDVTAESIVYKERPRWLWPALLLLLLAGAMAAAYYFLVTKAPDQAEEEDGVLAVAPDTTGQLASTDTSLAQTTARPFADTTPPTQPVTTQTQPKANQPEATSTEKRQSTRPAQPSYPRPNSLENYLIGLLNHEIPLQVRDQWRPAITKYFTPDAIIYTRMHGAPLGSFGVNEFIDILQSTEEGNSIIIDKVIRNEEDNAIEEMNVSIIAVE